MDDIIKISFPGLGIEEFTINRVAFSLFGLEVRWYGVIITFGILCAYFYAAYRARGEKIKTDDMIDIAMVTVISGIVGARLYYVLTTLDVISYESLLDVINIRRGGLAIYGGIIGGVIGIAVMAHIKRISLPRLLDCITPGVMIAQAIGRWGNFFNGEAFGEQTEIFCRMGLQKFDWA
ncbi:MAG: prolipoprotein diacylglyceryl transferase, partial [Clostridia bacterium]|nr:prolipoprotein diacylglyceryl transferase [Clostridia bacterium]